MKLKHILELSIFTCLFLTGCVDPKDGMAPKGKTFFITPQVAAQYDEFVKWDPILSYFVITEDGRRAYGVGCPKHNCGDGRSPHAMALEACRKANPGQQCFVFAMGNYIFVPYQVVQ
jgi:hypothetical protein